MFRPCWAIFREKLFCYRYTKVAVPACRPRALFVHLLVISVFVQHSAQTWNTLNGDTYLIIFMTNY
jgi:hypothetical protein